MLRLFRFISDVIEKVNCLHNFSFFCGRAQAHHHIPIELTSKKQKFNFEFEFAKNTFEKWEKEEETDVK